MDMTEVIAAVNAGARSDIEEAFRGLVDYPGEAGPMNASADALKSTMRKVCEALAGNFNIVPRATLDAVRGIYDDAEPNDGTYGGCAEFVLKRLDRWHAVALANAKRRG